MVNRRSEMNEELSYSVDHNQTLSAGVVNCGCTDHPTKLSEHQTAFIPAELPLQTVVITLSSILCIQRSVVYTR